MQSYYTLRKQKLKKLTLNTTKLWSYSSWSTPWTRYWYIGTHGAV